MSSDAPVFNLEFNDVHPYPVGVFREMALAFGEHDNLREVPNKMLFGQRVESTGQQPHLNEIKWVFMVRSATVVVGVFSYFMNPTHRLLTCLGIVGNLFPEHECVRQLRHHGMLNRFCERSAS